MNVRRITRTLICALTLVATAAIGSAREPAGRIKNVLLVMSDDLKASVLPAYGDTVCRTPNVDRLAASGMVFERAYCQGLACAPSRPSMLRSIYPTCTELLGLPTPKGLHGKSLLPLLRDPRAKARETALSIHNRVGGGLRSAEWHYMKYGERGEELYDMVEDPDQYTNVVSDSKYAALLEQARRQFKARMAAAR